MSKEIFLEDGSVRMMKDPLFMKGYLAGYWDGVRDSKAGSVAQWQESDIGQLPVEAMGVSSRACNCLLYSGCTYIKDVIALSDDAVRRMRNLGPKTASEIADWMMDHGIVSSAWSNYIKV